MDSFPIFFGHSPGSPEPFLEPGDETYRLTTNRKEAALFWYDLYALPDHGDPSILWKLLARRAPGSEDAPRFPIVTPWRSQSLGIQGRGDPATRLETSFLIRVLRHYGLCLPIPGFEAGDTKAERTRNTLRLSRLLRDRAPVDADRALSDLFRDLNDLRSIAGTVFKSLRWEDSPSYFFNEFVPQNGPGQGDLNNIAFLYSMSLYDRLGKWCSNRKKDDIVGPKAVGLPESDPRKEMVVAAKFEKRLKSYYGIDKNESLNSNATGRETFDPTYRILRDCARIVRHGVFPWIRHRNAHAGEAEVGTLPTIKILFIDDELQADDHQPRRHDNDYGNSLKSLFSLLAWRASGGVEIHVLNRPEGIFPVQGTPIGQSVDHLDRFISEELHESIRLAIDPQHGVVKQREGKYKIDEYDVIFVDVNFSDPYGGPQIVYALSGYLERRNAKARRVPAAANTHPHSPAVIVLTSNNRFDQAYECLNLGAHGFLTKDRILQSLVRLRLAVEEQERLAAAGRQWADHVVETFGHRNSFRMLHGLSLERKAALKKRGHDPDHVVVGDQLDFEWIRSIPKADLHIHLGSSISLPVIEALAWNSAGRMITAALADSNRPEKASDTVDHQTDRQRKGHASDVIEDALTVVFGGCALMDFGRFQGEYSQAFLTAAQWIVGDGTTGLPKIELKDPSTLKPLEDMLKILNWKDNAISEHYLSALLVVCLMIYSEKKKEPFNTGQPLDEKTKQQFRQHIEDTVLRRWAALVNMGDWHHALHQEDLTKPSRADPRDWRLETLNETLNLFLRLARSTRYALSHADPHDPKLWRTINRDIAARIHTAIDRIVDHMPMAEKKVMDRLKGILTNPPAGLGRASTLRRDNDDDWYSLILKKVPSFGELMDNTLGTEGHRRGLIRYLDKCSLLGSDHLQYPENLLLAAYDLVRQNVQDTVVYTEVRCETPGYTKAGMSAAGATDLLQLGFDSAAAFFFSTGGKPGGEAEDGQVLVRINVLLAAKRHKKREDCARVISLLERYLEKELRTATDFRKKQIPDWWGSSHVVGFDLSGDETVEKKDIQEEVQRLFRYNAPITIHAGEAASAESVWGAVYTYHARRIGHGLRLQENQKLMQYCVDEGICMELCPSSNMSTHGFLKAETLEEYKEGGNKAYPLRNYMDAGLEVCINTDNRSLHAPIYPEVYENDPDDPLYSPCPRLSVTDEYIRAAKLCGGLTRWEVLKLIRAGFRHSFLHRDDIARLLSAVESRLFAEVGQEPGTGWLPRVNRQMPPETDATA